jgi:Bacterial regulatory proteins, tetR family
MRVTAAEQADTGRRILALARERFAAHGFDSVTVRDVASAAAIVSILPLKAGGTGPDRDASPLPSMTLRPQGGLEDVVSRRTRIDRSHPWPTTVAPAVQSA